MSLEPPFLDPEYSEAEFWGVISDFGESSNQWGPYKFLVTRATIKHAQLGDRESTVKIKVGQESEGNLYLLGFTNLSELLGRSVKFHRKHAVIENRDSKWFVACQVKDAPKESKK